MPLPGERDRDQTSKDAPPIQPFAPRVVRSAHEICGVVLYLVVLNADIGVFTPASVDAR